jgi:uncharacterized oligopeptide transporter (OPT) family protein
VLPSLEDCKLCLSIHCIKETACSFPRLLACIGALIALVLQNAKPTIADQFILLINSGFLAGESLMGIAVALLYATGKI